MSSDSGYANLSQETLDGSLGEEFQFHVPPEAPVFEPTSEEFKNPLLYISKIRDQAEKCGICKIRPPADWQPPFAVDVDRFKFVPRVQRLNELEATTRIKLNFLDQIAKFWELQGSSLKIPMVERRALDLFSLHQIVKQEGGLEIVTKERKWSRVVHRMGLPSGRSLGALLKNHYERILYPYDVFQLGKTLEDVLAKYVCQKCNRGDAEEFMLLCDGCDDSYHTFCLLPPLLEIPKGDWRCPKCLAEAVNKQSEAFGFEQAQREYSLHQFGEMADQFKSDYFNMPVHRVPTGIVEKEFWRIVSSIEEDVTVEYGADLHTMDHGSGFPIKQTLDSNSSSDTRKYAESSWNLNNLPVLEGSVLGHINADISGMKVPWMYVGMCFATFCWHNEDHWSYSINYLHWGEPKTWYGVPGTKAERFEASMKKAATELFNSQPDLLHQLVTIMNPNVLMESGVPVYRTDQHAGEFVITFPRAYHAGFNQGYNFAEAVNFAPADWIQMGRECINHYATLHRFCVFSHDELVCKMSVNPENLDQRIAAFTYHDMLVMVDTEKKLRKGLLEAGVVKAEREAFELLPDDERQCDFCKTTCFLSAVTCDCKPNIIVCPKHFSQLCDCPNNKSKTMRYRYTLDELPVMIQRLKLKAESFDKWVLSVRDALDEETPTIIDLNGLKELRLEAEVKKFPDSELLKGLNMAIMEGEKCASVAQQCESSRMRTRTRLSQDNRCKLTVDELTLFLAQIRNLACKIPEEELISNLLDKVKEFQADAKRLLGEEVVDSKLIEEVIANGFFLNIELIELPALKEKLEQMRWLEDVKLIKEDNEQMTIENIKKLQINATTLTPFPELDEHLLELETLLVKMENWEENAQLLLESKEKPDIKVWKKLLKKVTDWISRAESSLEGVNDPYLDTVEDLASKGSQLMVQTAILPKLFQMSSDGIIWKERAGKVFLGRNTPHNLMEVLLPRPELGLISLKYKKRQRDSYSAYCVSGIKLQGCVDAKIVVAAFKKAEAIELETMMQLREENDLKKRLNNLDAKFCICRRRLFENMNECALCKDWFHACPRSGVQDLIELSRRPRIDTILNQLDALQSLPNRVPEGEFLQCLYERAMAWQDEVCTMLESGEMQGALGRLTALSARAKEAEARKKAESELAKAATATRPDFHPIVSSKYPLSNYINAKPFGDNQFGNYNGVLTIEENGTSGSDSFSYRNTEHAYSTDEGWNAEPTKDSLFLTQPQVSWRSGSGDMSLPRARRLNSSGFDFPTSPDTDVGFRRRRQKSNTCVEPDPPYYRSRNQNHESYTGGPEFKQVDEQPIHPDFMKLKKHHSLESSSQPGSNTHQPQAQRRRKNAEDRQRSPSPTNAKSTVESLTPRDRFNDAKEKFLSLEREKHEERERQEKALMIERRRNNQPIEPPISPSVMPVRTRQTKSWSRSRHSDEEEEEFSQHGYSVNDDNYKYQNERDYVPALRREPSYLKSQSHGSIPDSEEYPPRQHAKVGMPYVQREEQHRKVNPSPSRRSINNHAYGKPEDKCNPTPAVNRRYASPRREQSPEVKPRKERCTSPVVNSSRSAQRKYPAEECPVEDLSSRYIGKIPRSHLSSIPLERYRSPTRMTPAPRPSPRHQRFPTPNSHFTNTNNKCNRIMICCIAPIVLFLLAEWVWQQYTLTELL